ncbi:prepilin-type N-terminal cleavage/methylation domain-containing protein [Paenibacillus koleovorans]|uniref:prepilin-type N-terminal cleavage/methylation domain-containing protein n=1 Tax=Paenibacillus koleovorans TaxID=121608 RepID=UPI0013E2A20F|nr:prepilin-type N-terminal cleavage/methylation domain-containing protein [Paenibacillus koleovorans]
MNEMVMENKQPVKFRAPQMTLREAFKNEKGLTLIELLAVIVIIAIIAAIAIPSIGSILEKTRVNAHRSNAHMLIDASRLLVSSENITITGTGAIYLTMQELHDKGYLEVLTKDPSNKPETYALGAANTGTTPVATAPTAGSFVKVTRNGTTGNYEYSVTLKKLADAVTYGDDVAESAIETTGEITEDGVTP